MTDREKSIVLMETLLSFRDIKSIDDFLSDYSLENRSIRENVAVLRTTYNRRSVLNSWMPLVQEVYHNIKVQGEDPESWLVGMFSPAEIQSLELYCKEKE